MTEQCFMMKWEKKKILKIFFFSINLALLSDLRFSVRKYSGCCCDFCNCSDHGENLKVWKGVFPLLEFLRVCSCPITYISFLVRACNLGKFCHSKVDLSFSKRNCKRIHPALLCFASSLLLTGKLPSSARAELLGCRESGDGQFVGPQHLPFRNPDGVSFY